MSLRKIRARFIPSEAVGDVASVEVFGETLTADFAVIEVDDDVFAKLKGNQHIEVQVQKPTSAGQPAQFVAPRG